MQISKIHLLRTCDPHCKHLHFMYVLQCHIRRNEIESTMPVSLIFTLHRGLGHRILFCCVLFLPLFVNVHGTFCPAFTILIVAVLTCLGINGIRSVALCTFSMTLCHASSLMCFLCCLILL